MAFSYQNGKGQTYYLHERKVTLQGNNREQTIYFFARETKPGARDSVPDGYEVKETARTGLPVLAKKNKTKK